MSMGKNIIFRYNGDAVRYLEPSNLVLLSGISDLSKRRNIHIFVDYSFLYPCAFSNCYSGENDAFTDQGPFFNANSLAEHGVAYFSLGDYAPPTHDGIVHEQLFEHTFQRGGKVRQGFYRPLF